MEKLTTERLKIGALIFATATAAVCAGFVLGYFAFGRAATNTLVEAQIAVPLNYEEPPEPEEPEHKFVVTSRDDAIIVYSAGEEADIFDVAVNALPEPDRERLLQGIFANTEEELARILEDYGS
ncbi:MAG: hypothetical protein FWC70_01510 [Defluviitaleaceae bacterium]|nr:hypothetical protein [Defluviitaleaceae bacterium]